ncbi:hypothetical protein BP6252_08952 [Coleophoma cylindrospora]|uniref:DUF6594 domain-containing protein n=1 Tax=Coleophoma cylindrospora TaxID=1849047 RepID=A0A3D8R0J5_9HELO|nr:hypothetical protein BP6252_08952 [Coleophoma cylindrospora]
MQNPTPTPTTDSSSDSSTAFNSPLDSPASTDSQLTTQTDIHPVSNGDSNYPVEGWPLLAKLMEAVPEFAMLSRFEDLNLKMLLYYQAEIKRLQGQLDLLERHDHYHGDEETKRFARNLGSLIPEDEATSSKQWILVQRIQKLLSKYNKALLQVSQIAALPEPNPQTVENLRLWLKRTDGNNHSIVGIGADTWGEIFRKEEENQSLIPHLLHVLRALFWKLEPTEEKHPPVKSRLVAIKDPTKLDGFTEWVVREWIPFWHKQRPESKTIGKVKGDRDTEMGNWIPGSNNFPNSITQYSENSILRFTCAVATIVACLLPTLGIYIISTVDSIRIRILYIIGFTALFSMALVFFTNAAHPKISIFTATAAFSAVLVVFVQNA